MDNYGRIFKLIKGLIEKQVFRKLNYGKVLGVEIPGCEKSYYATVIPDLTVELGLMIFEGQKGLENLKALVDERIEPFDMMPRLNFIGVFFEEAHELLTPFEKKIQEKNPYGDYDGLGFPRLFRKNAGAVEKSVSVKDLEIIKIVLEQIESDSLKKLQSVMPFNEEIRITFRKKENNKWQRVIKKVSFTYKSILANELQLHSLKKNSEKLFKTWHLGLLYHMEPVYKGKYDEELVYPRGVFLIDSDETLINHSIHEGSENSIKATKELIEKTIRDLKIRPLKVVTDEEEVYFIFKDYFRVLDIEVLFDPDDGILYDFKAFNYEGMEEYDEELDLGVEDLFYTFLESKGVLPDNFDALEQSELDEIMKDFQEIIFDITETIEESNENGEFLESDAHKDLIKSHFMDSLSKDEESDQD